VFHDGKFFLLTDDSFIVYGGCDNWFNKVYERKLGAAITCEDDLQNVIQDYMNTCRNNFGDYVKNNVQGNNQGNIKKHDYKANSENNWRH